MKKFTFVVGNPPYQADVQNQGDRANPVYDKFLDASYKIAEKVEMIHPARFLFNAGQTSKAWNDKMLKDPHLKVLSYVPDAGKVFPNTDIKGGVAITYYSNSDDFGEIGTFTPFIELNQIIRRVRHSGPEAYLDEYVSSRGMYRLTTAFYVDYPTASEKVGKGSGNMIVSNIFDKIPEAFLLERPTGSAFYLKILGRTSGARVYRYIRADYVVENEYLYKYKLLFPEANASGRFGEVLSLPFIGAPGEGATDTFINIGNFDTEEEAEALLKYIKTKFLRALLGAKKATQHTPKSVWDLIPVQDFSFSSDIDWSVTIAEIDQQLYRKYKLSEEEIAFIESHVKEME